MFTHTTYFFENIISSLGIMFDNNWLSEYNKLTRFVFGEDYSGELSDSDDEDFQMWCINELDKAINGGYVQRYTFKNPVDLREDYEGPVQGWIFEPDGAFDDKVIVFTCNSMGLFKNNRYVCGVSICNDDYNRNFVGEEEIEEKVEVKEKEEIEEKVGVEENVGVEEKVRVEEKEEVIVKGIPSKEEIERIIGSGAKYMVHDDGTIDVDWAAFGILRIKEEDCVNGRLPLKFGVVDVDFECCNCGLTSLEGAPKFVGGDFKCNNNKLTSLVGGPEKVTGSYYCQNNQLASLVGAPKEIGHITKNAYKSFGTRDNLVARSSSFQEFDCQNNKITTLEGVDMHVMGSFKCAGNCISQKKKFMVVVEAGTIRWGKQNLDK